MSVFFRSDRVIAKTTGRDIPPDLFSLDLPAPLKAEGEGPISTARAGMKASDIEALYGDVKFRNAYVVNGVPASRVVFETRQKGSFVGITFVDGVVTGFEDLGGLPDDASLYGR